MPEEVFKNIFKIPVPLPGNPLKVLNSYLIRGDERDLLIDTGFNMPECREALERGLDELKAKRGSLDIYLTHLHSDHSGLSPEMVGREGHIYLSRTDYRYLEYFLSRSSFKERNERYLKEGYPEEVLLHSDRQNPAYRLAVSRLGDPFVPVPDDFRILAGGFEWEMVSCPGHTPGCTMLWNREHGIMFTGDHVLFDITPNITAWQGAADSLGDYLDSLRKALDYDVRLALPGHRGSGDYHGRIRALLLHHRRRLEETASIISSCPGLSAYEIAARMRWKIRASGWEDFPPAQKWFAVGECLAHLDYLRLRDVISAEERDGIRVYYL